MSGLISRVLVAVVGLPVVLGAVLGGGWWLFTLVAIAALIAVHEFVTMARPLRPLTPAAYVGTVLALLGAQKGGVVWMLGVLLTVFAADTFAFFGGRLFGRHKMAPTLSPGKTWEGFFVGSLVGMFVSFVALYQDRDHYLVMWQAVVLGLVVVLAAAAGDLFESMLKRDLQVKDTGNLLGGHGGVLDRVDALLLASAAAFYLVLGFNYA